MTQQRTLSQQKPISQSHLYLTLVHTVLLSAAAASVALAAPRSAKLVAINKANGQRVASAWLWRTEGTAAGSGAVAGHSVVFIEDRQWLKCLNLVTGQVRWQAKLAEPIAHTPVVGEKWVLVYTADRMWAYSLAYGRFLWTTMLPSEDGFVWSLSEESRPVIGQGLIFLCSGKRVIGMQASDGNLLWMYEHPAIRERQTPVLDPKHLYVRTEEEEAWMALTPSDGLFVEGGGHEHDGPRRQAPELQPPGGARSRATISPDRRALTLSHGGHSWKYQVPSPYTIGGIVGETPQTICIQIVEIPASSAKDAPAQQATAR